MAPMRRRDVVTGLENKGFTRQNKGHIKFTYVYKNGKKGPYTYVSRGSRARDIGDKLVDSMAKQLRLTVAEFVALVECPLGRDEFERILVDRRERGRGRPG